MRYPRGMKIIIGLGNPGKEYAKNRHNIGFMVVDKLAHDQDLQWREKPKLSAYLAKGDGFILVKPTTFMNNSGNSVQSVKNFYKTDEILVVCDDIDRDFGSMRTRLGGGAGGNNGLESIISAIGEGFARIRVGAQNEHRTPKNASAFVLSDFSKSETDVLPDVLTLAIKQINAFLEDKLEYHTVNI